MVENLEKIHVVASGVDTLELYSSAPLHQHWVAQLELLKKRASEQNAVRNADPVLVTVGGFSFVVQRTGGKRGSLRLENDDMSVSINPHAVLKLPRVTCEIRSRALWQDTDAVAAAAERVCDALCEGEQPDVQVSRVDVTADFQGWVPGEDLERHFVCRARRRAEYKLSNELTGWSFGGGGSTLARLYDKTVEIDGTDKAEWFPAVWAQNLHYVPGATVWRLEFQIRRETISDLECYGVDEGALKSWRDCRPRLNSIFHCLAVPSEREKGQKKCWLSLRLPRTGKTRQRPDPRWLRVGESADFKNCRPLVNLSHIERETEFKRCLDQLAGYTARAIAERWALSGVRQDAHATFLNLWRDMERHLEMKDTSLEEKAEVRFEPFRAQLLAEEARSTERRLHASNRNAAIASIWGRGVAPMPSDIQ